MLKFNQDRFLRSSDIKTRYSISNPTLHRWIRAGKLPKPKYLNRQMVWRQSAIEVAEKNMLSSKDRTEKPWGTES